MKSRNKVLLLTASALFLGACNGVVANKDISAIYSRLNHNERQITEINNQLAIKDGVVPGQAEMWAQIQSLRQDLAQISGQMTDWDIQAGSGENFSQLRQRVDNIEAAVRKLGSVLAIDLSELDGGTVSGSGQSGYSSQGGQQTFEGSKPIVASLRTGAEADQGAASGTDLPAAAVASGTADSAPVEAQPLDAPNQEMINNLYNSGTKAFSERRYADGVKIFQDFVTVYPMHNLTSNAYFWQAESYYQLKNYSSAIVAYQQVIEKFPGSAKLQSAMFKQGVSMYNRGQQAAGKVRLNELVSKYPKSPEADRARQFLQKNP